MTKNNWQEVEAEINPVWDFTLDDQEELKGVLVRKEENVGPNDSWMYTIETRDGQRFGVWGNTVLDSRFTTIEQGMEVKIEYRGIKQSDKTNRSYKDFVIYKRSLPMKEVDES